MVPVEEMNVAVATSLHDEQRSVRKTAVWTASREYRLIETGPPFNPQQSPGLGLAGRLPDLKFFAFKNPIIDELTQNQEIFFA